MKNPSHPHNLGSDVPAGSIEMPRYRSHKTVWALKIATVTRVGESTDTSESPIVDLTFTDPRYAPMSHVSTRDKPCPEAGWYFVRYADGYHSFSPAKQFEDGNTLDDKTTDEAAPLVTNGGIGWAVKQLQHGSLVRRTGWNGKGMFLLLVPGSRFQVNRHPLLGIFPEGTEVDYNAHVDIRGVDGKITPWQASQTDLLATDWEIA